LEDDFTVIVDTTGDDESFILTLSPKEVQVHLGSPFAEIGSNE
jgi:hypothetical protein